ncbi:glycolate oxidase [Dethiosulfatibacter aminovorans DSM 17477]|uniref:Glycolate oxidase n=1 Tax=Dethiosulfatibacter aminovorans DSM 17477 TaxID=1121476 RepID=A0A1M6BPV1_9FIRM|nr:FAD-binding oxidoreductase [Dethiosulfatibacter aminovorans]SHI50644.1 glycolate oxidase [Dethiosulfatibacter aminovorans DSM 17477]
MKTETARVINEEIIGELRNISGNDWVVSDMSQMESYLYDETELAVRPVAADGCVVVKPGTAEEVSGIVKLANEYKIPVVPRGGGTGLCGAAIPTKSSIVVSLERLNKLVEFDNKNIMITVEAGVTLEGLLEMLKEHDKLFFPVHPGDEGAQIGGMVVENAGGVRAVKHGIMRNHIKGVEVVLPTGELVTLGGKLIKNNMGYDLLHMMIGSEGTLGIVTKVTLKLYAKNPNIGTLLVSFNTTEEASDIVPKILQDGITPLAIEYMDREVALESAEHIGQAYPATEGSVDLMFILDEATEDELYEKCERIVGMCEENGAVDSLIAESTKEQRALLEIRSNVYTAYKENIADALDIAVPSGSVPDMLKDISAIAKKYNTISPAVGHIADGNVHNFLMLDNGEIPEYLDDMRNEMYDAAISYGGTVTAEHGTGKTRKRHMEQQYSAREIEIMQNIKKAFDPNGIFNPGTIVD